MDPPGAGGKPRERLGPVGRKRSASDRRPRARGQSVDEATDYAERAGASEDLVLVDEVPDIRARETLARRAGAVGLERPWIAAEARVVESIRPVAVSAEPVRAVRVGNTQSNMSMPAAMTPRIPPVSPSPMK